MEQTKEINATITNEELQNIDAGKDPNATDAKGKKVDKGEIINMISQLPLKERLDLIRDLQAASNHDADQYSLGQKGNTSSYDTLRDEYQKKAKDAEKKEGQTK